MNEINTILNLFHGAIEAYKKNDFEAYKLAENMLSEHGCRLHIDHDKQAVLMRVDFPKQFFPSQANYLAEKD